MYEAWQCLWLRCVLITSRLVIVGTLTARAGPHNNPLRRTVHTWPYGKMHVGWMNAWMHGQTNEQMIDGIDAWLHACLDKWMSKRLNECMSAYIHGWLINGLQHWLGHLATACFERSTQLPVVLRCPASFTGYKQFRHCHSQSCICMQQTGWKMLFTDLKGQSHRLHTDAFAAEHINTRYAHFLCPT